MNIVNILKDAPLIFCCMQESYKYCIPYKGNESLLGTSKNSKEDELLYYR